MVAEKWLKFHLEVFNLKNMKDVKVKEQCHAGISNWFAHLEHMDDRCNSH
jgi:hypothetical protein